MTARNQYTPEERAHLRALEEHPGYALLMDGLGREEALAAKRLETGGWESVLETRGFLRGLRLARRFVARYSKEPEERDD